MRFGTVLGVLCCGYGVCVLALRAALRDGRYSLFWSEGRFAARLRGGGLARPPPPLPPAQRGPDAVTSSPKLRYSPPVIRNCRHTCMCQACSAVYISLQYILGTVTQLQAPSPGTP